MSLVVRRAVAADQPDVLSLVERFYAHDGYPYDEEMAVGALGPLLADDTHGMVWIGAVDDMPVAYAVLTWGWSLESGGPEAVLDELYADRRGEGFGGLVIEHALRAARERGTRRVFIETERTKDEARRFYLRHGFTVEESIWMKVDLV